MGSDALEVHDFQYKVSWCMMEAAKRGGLKIQTFERKVLHKGKTKTTVYYMPVKREKKIMTTWVKKLPTGDVSPYLSLSVFIYVCICAYACLTCCFTSAEVLRIVQENGGKATATSLSMLKQKHRALTVPLTIHPTTSTKKRSTQINTTNISVFRSFRKTTRTPSAVLWSLPREGSSEDEEAPSHSSSAPPTCSGPSGGGFDLEMAAQLRYCPLSGLLNDKDYFIAEFGENAEQKWAEAKPPESSAHATAKRKHNITAENRTEKRVKVKMPAYFVSHVLIPLLSNLNDTLDEIPDKHTLRDVKAAYDRFCTKQPEFRSATMQKRLDFNLFHKWLKLRHPLIANEIIGIRSVRVRACVFMLTIHHSTLTHRKHRTQWSCKICAPLEYHDFTKQNVICHYVCDKHRKNLTATQTGSSNVLESGVRAAEQEHVYRSELCNAIVDDAIVSSCRKSLPFTAVPVMLDHTARALGAVAGPKLNSVDCARLREFSKEAADIILRLKAVTAQETTRNGHRMACRRGRHYVSDRVQTLAKRVVKLKVDFLRKCGHLCMSADETDAYSLTAPLAVSLQGCDNDFNWANFFIGQEDVATDKSGKGCYEAIKKVILKACMEAEGEEEAQLWKSIYFSVTDGASAMRSSPLYAGLDAKEDGESVVAQFKKNGKTLMGNLHCICHNLNLALKEALKHSKLGWSDAWLKHVRAVYNWFAKSPARKAEFKNLSSTMEVLAQVLTPCILMCMIYWYTGTHSHYPL